VTLALAWIVLRSLRGRVVRAARMLRRPKYLVGFAVGAGWLSFWIGPAMFSSAVEFGGAAALVHLPDDVRGVLRGLAAAALAVWIGVAWLVPWGRANLGFREAELSFLLPAPVPRRQILGYALWRAQPGILLTALLFATFVGQGWADRMRLGAGTWVLLTTLDLANKARGLFLLRQREVSPRTARRRRGVVVAVVAAVAVAVLPWVVLTFRAVWAFLHEDAITLDGLWDTLVGRRPDALVRGVLTPFAWVLGPVLAADLPSFVVALVPALAVLVALREIVVRSRARFEETAFVHARQSEERKAKQRSWHRVSARSRERAPFALAPAASPALAIVWKNVARVSRRPLADWSAAAVALALTLGVAQAMTGWIVVTAPLVATLGAMLVVMPSVLAGSMWSNDLRAELGSLDAVRTWPIDPVRLVAAETAAPALLSAMAASAGAGLVVATALAVRLRRWVTGELAFDGAAGAVLGVPGDLFVVVAVGSILIVAVAVGFFSAAVQNLVVLWLPAWIPRGGGAAGMSALGSQILLVWALGLAIAAVAVPGALLAGALGALQWWLGVPWHALELPLAAIVVATPIAAGGALAVRFAARLWERLDASAEILES
jgi:hypothetical protein